MGYILCMTNDDDSNHSSGNMSVSTLAVDESDDLNALSRQTVGRSCRI
jgi:hypothetical protein